MGKNRWTEEQRRVIEGRDSNLLVAAAAGAGKTAVLVERIINKITDAENPADIDKMLIMTFTNAAAAEMKERIGQAIDEKLNEASGERASFIRNHLISQQMLLHTAQITTIHSFCLSVLREFFHESELDPSFRIADESELKLIKADVMADLLEAEYLYAKENNDDRHFIDFVEGYGRTGSDAVIEELVLELYKYSSGYPWPSEWYDAMENDFTAYSEEELEQKSFMTELKKQTGRLIRDCLYHNAKALADCTRDEGLEVYNKILREEEDFFRELLNADDYEELQRLIAGYKFKVFPRTKNGTDAALKEKVTAERRIYKDILNALRENFYFCNRREVLNDICAVREHAMVLIRLARSFAKKFAEEKRKRNVIDFDDIEHFALDILTERGNMGEKHPSAHALELRKRYSEIMIDEYQDSNRTQDIIASFIAGDEPKEPFLFMVGDVKQSIYKFRMARPELFAERQRSYLNNDSYGVCIELNRNFRSRPEVLDSCNSVFASIMSSDMGGVDYGEAEKLKAGRETDAKGDEGERYKTEVILAEITDEPAEGTEYSDIVGTGAEIWNEKDSKKAEALAALQRIEELCNDEKMLIQDKNGGYRRVGYGDIAILLRTMGGWVEAYTEVLSDAGISVMADTRTGFFRTTEVRNALDYLRILDNPRQDIPLVAVLYSAIGDFGSNALARIRLSADKTRSYYDALLAFAGDTDAGNQELREKVCGFLNTYNEIREQMYGKGIGSIISMVYDMTGLYNYVSAMKNGEQRRKNLDMLLAQATAYETTSYTGIFNFIKYIERLISYDTDYGEAVAGEEGNAVRIMSIHKSKGLEFPIVIAGGMGKQFNQSDLRSKAVCHADCGIGLDRINSRLRTKASTLQKKVIQELIKRDTLSEEERVLYVAMTRAREKLILIGTVKDYAKSIEKWKGAVDSFRSGDNNICILDSYLMKAASYLDFVCPIALSDEKNFTVRHRGSMHSGYNEKQENYIYSVSGQTDEYDKELAKIMNFVYPFERANELPPKLTVSEIKHLSFGEFSGESLFEQTDGHEGELTGHVIPEFIGVERRYSGADRGTLYHKLVQLLRLPVRTPEELDRQLDDMKERQIFTEEELQLINKNSILLFTGSGMAERMLVAEQKGNLFKEQPFVMNVALSDIQPESADACAADTIAVQGVIDVFFEEEDGFVILDYKTDNVPESGGEEELLRRYGTQLDLYAEAVRRITQKPVKEKLIYSFRLSKFISI